MPASTRISYTEQPSQYLPAALAGNKSEVAERSAPAIQKQTAEEELPAQAKYPAQLQAEEEEPLQGRFANIQRQSPEEEEPVQGKFMPAQRKTAVDTTGPSPSVPFQKKENKTGLPDNLKSGIENLSGFSMDHVNVHYNSGKPAQLNALAYAQGTDIHVAPGQEQHLPHEAWHVVQQMQGRVQPTMQLKEDIPVNDDKGLEKEADVMGERAVMQYQTIFPSGNINELSRNPMTSTSTIQRPLQRRILMVEPDPDWIMLRNAHVLSTDKQGGTIEHYSANPDLNNIEDGEFLYLVGHGNSKSMGVGINWSPEKLAEFINNANLPKTHRYILLSGVCNSASGERSFAEVLRSTLAKTYKYERIVVIGAVGLAIAGFHDGWQDKVVKPENKEAELALEQRIMKMDDVSEGIRKAKEIISKKEIPDITTRAGVIANLVEPFYIHLAEEHIKEKDMTFDKDDPAARIGFY